MPSPSVTAYTFFGVKPDASSRDIQAAYCRKIAEAKDTGESVQADKWYSLVKSTSARLRYDIQLQQASATASASSPKEQTTSQGKEKHSARDEKTTANEKEAHAVARKKPPAPDMAKKRTAASSRAAQMPSLFARIKDKMGGASTATATATTSPVPSKAPPQPARAAQTGPSSKMPPAGSGMGLLSGPRRLGLGLLGAGSRSLPSVRSVQASVVRHAARPRHRQLIRHLRRGQRLPRWAIAGLAVLVGPLFLLLLAALVRALLWPTARQRLRNPLQPTALRLDRTHYGVLGLTSKDATSTEIRAAYLRSVLAHHPDKQARSGPHRNKNKHTRAQADTPMHRITRAYEILKDPYQRCMYDRELAGRWITRPSTACLQRKPWETTDASDSKVRQQEAKEKEQEKHKDDAHRGQSSSWPSIPRPFSSRPPAPAEVAVFQNAQMVVYRSASSLLYRMIRMQLRVQFALVDNFRRLMDVVYRAKARIRKMSGRK